VCLTPPPRTICQLYREVYFVGGGNLVHMYLEKTHTDLWQIHGKLYQ
jgi:hypothetical protein